MDTDIKADGSTLLERLRKLTRKYPNAILYLYSDSELPDPEKVKFVNGKFVPLSETDLTPRTQTSTDRVPVSQLMSELESLAVTSNVKQFLRKVILTLGT